MRAYTDLHKHNSVSPLWMLAEKALDGRKFKWHSLQALKTINAYHNLSPRILCSKRLHVLWA
jgi:hypothetical protein